MGVDPEHFASWDPHFTPQWLSAQMASRLAAADGGVVLDPACGSGNLLVAAHHAAAKQGNSVRLFGIDSRKRAIADCSLLRSLLGAQQRRRTLKADFLELRRSSLRMQRPLNVIMNPPFGGYGTLSRTRRKRLSRKTSLSGRFNLAHAFVVHSIETFRPQRLVALLPANWARSESSHLGRWLEESGGKWTWNDTPGDPFPGISAKVGILEWSDGAGVTDETTSDREEDEKFPFEVKCGVATGCDAAFLSLAEVGAFRRRGRIALAIRGREVGRKPAKWIWVPPSSDTQLGCLVKATPRALRKSLSGRSCVSTRSRHLLEYHDKLPGWFLDEPKILVPEIATGNRLRVTSDPEGLFLPLHSTIAIRAGTKRNAREVARALRTARVCTELRDSGARLNGNAFRLSVRSIRRLSLRLR